MRRPSPSMAVAIAALVAALGGVAVASPIGGDGKVHLCYSQKGVDDMDGNQVVAVNAGAPCPADYPDALVLNQTGPAGAPGAPGPQGPGGQVIKLGDKIAKDAIKGLEKADKVADKQEDKLRALEKKIAEQKSSAQSKQQEALWQKQQQLAQTMKQITKMLEEIAAANQQVIKSLR
jgi:hypothetical protein